jgi:hypothetical protein
MYDVMSQVCTHTVSMYIIYMNMSEDTIAENANQLSNPRCEISTPVLLVASSSYTLICL